MLLKEVMIFRDTQTLLLTGGSNWLEVMISRDTQTPLLTGSQLTFQMFGCDNDSDTLNVIKNCQALPKVAKENLEKGAKK